MLNYSECLPRKAILIEGHPYEVITSHVFQKQKSRPVNNVRLKSLLTGKTLDPNSITRVAPGLKGVPILIFLPSQE
jgi:translation elongation factor P/translation initiation factor 5A